MADILKCIFHNEIVWISIKISLKFVPKGQISHIPALVQIMAWRRSGDMPLSKPMMLILLTHVCVTRPQWFKSRTTYNRTFDKPISFYIELNMLLNRSLGFYHNHNSWQTLCAFLTSCIENKPSAILTRNLVGLVSNTVGIHQIFSSHNFNEHE